MPFLLSFLASISTTLGVIPIIFKFKNIYRIINIALSFAAGIMLSVSILDLIPESISMINISFLTILYMLISFNIGFIVSSILNKKIRVENGLYRVGVITLLGIIMHNIPEGVATYLAASKDITLGINLTVAIAMHNIPEGIGIAIPIYFSTKSKTKAFLYTLISGLSELFGTCIGIFIKSNSFIPYLLIVIAGIMIHIALYDLLPQSLRYKNIKHTIISSGVGVVVMIISVILTK